MVDEEAEGGNSDDARSSRGRGRGRDHATADGRGARERSSTRECAARRKADSDSDSDSDSEDEDEVEEAQGHDSDDSRSHRGRCRGRDHATADGRGARKQSSTREHAASRKGSSDSDDGADGSRRGQRRGRVRGRSGAASREHGGAQQLDDRDEDAQGHDSDDSRSRRSRDRGHDHATADGRGARKRSSTREHAAPRKADSDDDDDAGGSRRGRRRGPGRSRAASCERGGYDDEEDKYDDYDDDSDYSRARCGHGRGRGQATADGNEARERSRTRERTSSREPRGSGRGRNSTASCRPRSRDRTASRGLRGGAESGLSDDCDGSSHGPHGSMQSGLSGDSDDDSDESSYRRDRAPTPPRTANVHSRRGGGRPRSSGASCSRGASRSRDSSRSRGSSRNTASRSASKLRSKLKTVAFTSGERKSMPYRSPDGAATWADVSFVDLQRHAPTWFHAGLNNAQICQLDVRFQLAVTVSSEKRDSEGAEETRLAGIVSEVDWKELKRTRCVTIHIMGDGNCATRAALHVAQLRASGSGGEFDGASMCDTRGGVITVGKTVLKQRARKNYKERGGGGGGEFGDDGDEEEQMTAKKEQDQYDSLMRTEGTAVKVTAILEEQYHLIKHMTNSRKLLGDNLPTGDARALLSPRLFWCGFCAHAQAGRDEITCIRAVSEIGKLSVACNHYKRVPHDQLPAMVRGKMAGHGVHDDPRSGKLTAAQMTSAYTKAPSAEEFATGLYKRDNGATVKPSEILPDDFEVQVRAAITALSADAAGGSAHANGNGAEGEEGGGAGGEAGGGAGARAGVSDGVGVTAGDVGGGVVRDGGAARAVGAAIAQAAAP